MVQKFNEVESVFNDEVFAKKKEFKDFRNATKGRRLGKNNVMFASDFMSRKEKIKHRKAGEVLTTNMYQDILPFEEFDALETYEKRNRMQYWRTEKSNKEILAGMGISNKKYYDLVAELELPKAPRTNSGKPRKGSSKKQEPKETKPVAVQVQVQETVPEQVQTNPVQEIMIDGLNLVFQGTYNAELIQKQLTKFSLLLEDEPEEFYFEFRLMQKQPNKK